MRGHNNWTDGNTMFTAHSMMSCTLEHKSLLDGGSWAEVLSYMTARHYTLCTRHKKWSTDHSKYSTLHNEIPGQTAVYVKCHIPISKVTESKSRSHSGQCPCYLELLDSRDKLTTYEHCALYRTEVTRQGYSLWTDKQMDRQMDWSYTPNHSMWG